MDTMVVRWTDASGQHNEAAMSVDMARKLFAKLYDDKSNKFVSIGGYIGERNDKETFSGGSFNH